MTRPRRCAGRRRSSAHCAATRRSVTATTSWRCRRFSHVIRVSPKTVRRRGGEPVDVIVSSARVQVCAHGKKRFVVVLKYVGETEYRYLVATDLSWRTMDIVQAHTLRGLVEVFLEDWKLYAL